MYRIGIFIKNINAFWSNPQRRKTVTWVIGALSVAVIAFGAYTALTAQFEYNDLSDELDTITGQIKTFEEGYPLVERDGEQVRDLTEASQEDLQVLALLRTRERTTFNDRVDVENERGSGVRLIGIGVIGLALAYLVLPEGKDQPETISEQSAGEDHASSR